MIFEYSDSSHWLKDELARRAAENPLFSGSAFAKKLGVSQSYFSLVLAKKRPLSEKAAQLISIKLNLSKLEQSYLMLLVKKEKSKDAPVRELLNAEICRFRKANRVDELSLDNFKVISDWYYSAILELINVADFPHTVRNFARRLDIDIKIAAEAIERLLSLKLIKKETDRYVRVDGGYLATPTEIASSGLKIFHKQILQKAIRAVDEQEVKDRVFSGITMAIDPEKLPLAKKKIEEFKKELSALLETGNKKRIYQFSIQLFRLDKEQGEKYV